MPDHRSIKALACRFRPVAALAALALCAVPASRAHAQNLIVNGSFEEPALEYGTFDWLLKVPGWTVGKTSTEIQNHVDGSPADGEQHVELDTWASGWITQQVETTPGAVYRLVFAYSPRPYWEDNRINVLWNDVVVIELNRSWGGKVFGTDWEYVEVYVAADSALSSLTFQDASESDGAGGYIDDVRLELVTVTPPPRFEPAPGIVHNLVNVTLTNVAADATIWYTTDGSAPDTSSPSTPAGGSVFIPASGTLLRAYASSPERTNSALVEGEYIYQVAAPTIDPLYATTPVTVTLTSVTEEAAIYYTLDGSEPTPKNGTLYEGPLDLEGTTTVRAAAFRAGFEPNDVTTLEFRPSHVVHVEPAGLECEWGYQLFIDMNGNGTSDVGVINFEFMRYPYAGCRNELVTRETWSMLGAKLEPGAPISPGSAFSYGYPATPLFNGEDGEGEWSWGQTGLVGFRFYYLEQLHYGWMRLRMPARPGTSLAVLEWAYETQPNTPIQAGVAPPACPPEIVWQPTGISILAHEQIDLNAVATGDVTYQWFRDGAPLDDGDRISGAASSKLQIVDARPADSGAYSVVATSKCGDATSESAVVSVAPVCPPFSGSAVRFNGNGARISTPDDPTLDVATAATFEAWFFASSLEEHGRIISKGTGFDFWGNSAFDAYYNGRVNVRICFGPQGAPPAVWMHSSPVPLNEWHHFAATIDTNAGVARIFIDGQLDVETTTLVSGAPIPHIPVRNSSRPFCVAGDGYPFFHGDVDEVRLWSVARTPAEIASSYRAAVDPASPGLIIYYRLDDGVGPVAQNAVGSGNNGTLWGSAAWVPTVPCCGTDVNADGVVNSTDVSEFINRWFQDQFDGTLNADWDHNGVVNSTDVSFYINAWFEETAAGCGG